MSPRGTARRNAHTNRPQKSIAKIADRTIAPPNCYFRKSGQSRIFRVHSCFILAFLEQKLGNLPHHFQGIFLLADSFTATQNIQRFRRITAETFVNTLTSVVRVAKIVDAFLAELIFPSTSATDGFSPPIRGVDGEHERRSCPSYSECEFRA